MDGMARLMDFEGVLVRREKYEGFEADVRNLRGDWERIGGYMRTAMDQVTLEQDKQ